MKLKPYNIIDRAELPEIMADQFPVNGDPLEINDEMYYVCETNCREKEGMQWIGVIPLVIKNPGRVKNIESYKKYLAVALRRNQFLKRNNILNFKD